MCSGLSMLLQLHVFCTNERSKSVIQCLCVAGDPLRSEARALLIISSSALRHCRPDVNHVTAVLDTVYIINLLLSTASCFYPNKTSKKKHICCKKAKFTNFLSIQNGASGHKILVYLCCLFVTTSVKRSSSLKESSPRARRIMSGFYIVSVFSQDIRDLGEQTKCTEIKRRREISRLFPF